MSSQITPLFPVSGTDTAKVQGIPVSTVDPINGQVLVYNEATSQYEPAVATTGATEIILGTNDNLFAEVSTFTFLGDPVAWQGQYFSIGVPTGQAYVWFNRENNAEDPSPAGFVRGIAIDPGDVFYGNASQNRTIYANRMVTVFSTDPDLSATKNGDQIILTSRANGERSNIALVTISGSDASVAVVTEGGGMKGSMVLKSGNANADVSIKNIDGNIRFEKSSGNVILGNAAGTIALTSQLPTFGAGVATALALATNATGGVVLAGGTSSLNINGTVGETTPAAGAFTSGTFTTSLKSNTALATPSALTATEANFYASTVSGASISGFGTTNDVTLRNRAGTVCLGVGPNTTTVSIAGNLLLGTNSTLQGGYAGGAIVASLNSSGTEAGGAFLAEQFYVRNAGQSFVALLGNLGKWNSAGVVGFTTGTNAAGTNIATGISRISDGLLAIGTGASASFAGSLKATNAEFVGTLTVAGNVLLGKTITASGTTGAQTINKSSGSVNFAAAATSLVVTNSLATVNSVIVVSKGTNDATARLGAAVAAAGSFTIHMDVAPATETRVNFILTN